MPKKWLENRIVSDGFWNSAIQGARLPLVIATSVVVARSLRPEFYGQYQLVLAYFGVAQLVSLPGMGPALQKALLKGEGGFARIAWRWCLPLPLLVGIGIIGSAYTLVPADEQFSALIIGLLTCFCGLDRYQAVLVGHKRLVAMQLFETLQQLCIFAFVGATAYWLRDLHLVMLAFLAARATFLALAWMGTWWLVGGYAPAMEASAARPFLKQGLEQSGLTAVNIVSGRVDRILLGSIDPISLSIYHIGSIIPQKLKNNLKTLMNVVVVHWGGQSKLSNLQRIKKHFLALLLVSASATIAVFFAAPLLIPLLYGEEYADAVPVTQILALLIFPNMFSNLVVGLDQFQNFGKFVLAQGLISHVIRIALLVVLIPVYGLYGAVFAVASTKLLVFVMCVGFFFYEWRNAGK